VRGRLSYGMADRTLRHMTGEPIITVTLPPCLIFKGQDLNSGWIPNETPAGWRFITSKIGWTSDLIGFEWLKTHFQSFVSQTTHDTS
jgi:hypothetical protein